MKRLAILVGTLLTVLIGASANAYDFSKADALFKQRDNNLSAIAQARGLYEQALNSSSSKEDLMHAVERLGKLAYYEGDLLLAQNESSKRAQVFSKCLEYVESISPAQIGKTGAYFYWKTACLALWGRAAGMFAAAGRLGELKESMKQGLALDPDYAGGGMDRVIATINLRASWLSGLQDYNAALEHINKAVVKGPQYFNVYIVKAEILKALDRDNEALVVLETAKRELEKLIATNNLPTDLEAESRIFLKQIKTALRN